MIVNSITDEKRKCYSCKKLLLLDTNNFYKSKKKTGFRYECKKCNSKVGNTEKRRFRNYKYSAQRRNLEFKIDLSDFVKVWNKDCYYCGQSKKTGVDRFDSNFGYLPGNIVPCCWGCNRAKAKIRGEKFIEICKMIAKNN